MKRFLRYVVYRELYRALRSSDKDTGSGQSSRSVQQAVDREAIPAEGTVIDEPSQLIAVLQQMDPYAFEHLVADLWERMGWETEVPSPGADEGVDVIARKAVPYEQTTLIQAKRYGPDTTVGSPEIQQYASLKHQYEGVDKVVMVTTNRYTGQAQQLADRLNVKLVDGQDLVELVAAHDAVDILDEHIEFVSVVDEPADQTSTSEESAVETDTTPDTHRPRNVANAGQLWPRVPDEPLEPVSPTMAYGVALASVLWVSTVGLTEVSELATGLVGLVAWIGLPLCLYLDTRRIEGDWPPRRWVYLALAAVPVFGAVAGAIYLLERRAIEWG